MKILTPLVLLLLSLTASAQDKPVLVDKIVGIVGDKVILLSDIELQYHQMQMDQQTNLPINTKCALLDQMMTNKMFLEQALLDSIKVTDDEIESELDRRIRYFVNMIGSEEKLEAYYEKSISQIKDEFRNDIKEQLLSQREQSKIYENIKVTPSEVKDFFKSIPKDSLPYYNAEVEVGEIAILPKVAPEQKAAAKKKAQELLDRIKNGEDFATLAKIYSEDPGTAEKGGDLGAVTRGQMVTEFEAAAFNLTEPNELSPVIETKFGYHIIQLISRHGERLELRHILIKPKVTSYDLAAARDTLDSIRTLILNKAIVNKDTLTFSRAVSLFSEDEATKYQGGTLQNSQNGTSYFEVGQLDKAVYFTIEKMEPGEISEPVLYTTPDGGQAYRILLLKSESKPHQANLTDDFYKIKAAALAKMQDNELKKWIGEKIKTTYTFVDMHYEGCDMLDKWNKPVDVIENSYE